MGLLAEPGARAAGQASSQSSMATITPTHPPPPLSLTRAATKSAPPCGACRAAAWWQRMAAQVPGPGVGCVPRPWEEGAPLAGGGRAGCAADCSLLLGDSQCCLGPAGPVRLPGGERPATATFQAWPCPPASHTGPMEWPRSRGPLPCSAQRGCWQQEDQEQAWPGEGRPPAPWGLPEWLAPAPELSLPQPPVPAPHGAVVGRRVLRPPGGGATRLGRPRPRPPRLVPPPRRGARGSGRIQSSHRKSFPGPDSPRQGGGGRDRAHRVCFVKVPQP